MWCALSDSIVMSIFTLYQFAPVSFMFKKKDRTAWIAQNLNDIFLASRT